MRKTYRYRVYRKLSCLAQLFAFLIFSVCVHAQHPAEPIFKDGDRVCFVGNSITNNGLFYNYISQFYATRYPERKVLFVNCGISGDVTQGIINRLDSDILVHKPTWSVLMIGMNDVSRNLYAKSRENEPGIEDKKRKALELYRKNLEIIVKKLLEDGRKLILQKPTIYDQTGDLAAENFYGVNDALKKCADYGQELADKYHLPTVDYWTIMTDLNKKLQAKDPKATIIGPDRVHPAGPGHLIMAYAFLKATGGAEYVSRISIDKNLDKSNKASSNCVIKDLVYKNADITFSVREGSLPFPVAPDAASALELIPFTEAFNKEILQVGNMATGDYRLLIDNSEVGTFSSGELKRGVNLALLSNTPQYQQAQKIAALYSDYRKTQSMYRNIVTIQIHHLPDSLKNGPLNAVETFLNKRLEEKYKESPQYNYYKGQFKSYLSNKSREAEIIKTLPEILTTVRESNKPVFHTFRLVKK